MIARKSRKSAKDLTSRKFQALIDLANKCDDPFSTIDPKWRIYEVNGQKFKITCAKSSNLSFEQIDSALQLTKENMHEMYEQSPWGWNDESKRKELAHKNAYIAFVHLMKNELNEDSSSPIAFMHFRFEYGEDEVHGVCYCYELQIKPDFQRLGIGAFLMQTLIVIGKTFRMFKVMLTCFNHNPNALEFYQKKMQFHIDRHSPSKFPGGATFYEILSYKIE